LFLLKLGTHVFYLPPWCKSFLFWRRNRHLSCPSFFKAHLQIIAFQNGSPKFLTLLFKSLCGYLCCSAVLATLNHVSVGIFLFYNILDSVTSVWKSVEHESCILCRTTKKWACFQYCSLLMSLDRPLNVECVGTVCNSFQLNKILRNNFHFKRLSKILLIY